MGNWHCENLLQSQIAQRWLAENDTLRDDSHSYSRIRDEERVLHRKLTL